MSDSSAPTPWFRKYWRWTGAALFLLITVDLLTSMYAVAAVGIEHESNPVMAWLLARPLWVIAGVHLVAVGLLIFLFYGLAQLVRETPPAYRGPFKRLIEAFLGLLLAAGLFVFANNLAVIVYGRSLL
ncbi:DUF5658 family protein [Halopenitus persicus]|uniref:DUF5658 family protein n=1 Tax=Halopenitus persicus TaxID=1048396 RepID=UPI000BBAB44E|nr:DUF5658 family protein [Halopenitus persicus]